MLIETSYSFETKVQKAGKQIHDAPNVLDFFMNNIIKLLSGCRGYTQQKYNGLKNWKTNCYVAHY